MWHAGRILGFSSILTMMLALASPDVFAQKKKDKKAADTTQYPQATEADYSKLQKYLSGKLVNYDGKSLIVRADIPHLETNPNYRPPNPANANAQANQQLQMWRAYNDLMVQQQRALTATTAKQMTQIQNRIAQDMMKIQVSYNTQMMQAIAAGAKAYGDPNNQPFITVNNTKDYDLEIQDKAPIRKMFLALEYDDEGKIKKYSDEEKLALRGDDKTKPGYAAKADEVQVGQEVKALLHAAEEEGQG